METIEEMERHIRVLRVIYVHGPFTVIAYSIARIWSLISMLLIPVGWVSALIVWGVIFIPILRLPIFAVQSFLYFPMIAILIGTSRLWFRLPYLRLLLIIPGIGTAIIASAYLTMFGVERDDIARFKKISDAEEWPLTSLLWDEGSQS